MADELMNLDGLRAILEDLARDVEVGYKEELERNDHYTTLGPDARKLINSVHTRVEVHDTVYEVKMDLEEYWKYLETGTRPHWPPLSAIQRWVEYKPVLPTPDASGRIPSPKSLAFLIARKISRVGTKGTHDLEKTKDAVITAYRDKLEAALSHDIYDYLVKVLPPQK